MAFSVLEEMEVEVLLRGCDSMSLVVSEVGRSGSEEALDQVDVWVCCHWEGVFEGCGRGRGVRVWEKKRFLRPTRDMAFIGCLGGGGGGRRRRTIGLGVGVGDEKGGSWVEIEVVVLLSSFEFWTMAGCYTNIKLLKMRRKARGGQQ